MTPPDSGDLQHECRCAYHIVGRDAEGSHTWSKCKPHSGERCCDLADKGHRAGCPGKPDSGEREVLSADDIAVLHELDAGGEATALEWRASVLAAHPFLLAEVERGRKGVLLPLSLAQRILAALEDVADADMIAWRRTTTEQLQALADELRAIVERK